MVFYMQEEFAVNINLTELTLSEIKLLFDFNVKDEQFYFVIASAIVQLYPDYFFKHIHSYHGIRLKAAIFALSHFMANSFQIKQLFLKFLQHKDPLIITEVIQAFIYLKDTEVWEALENFKTHFSPYVRKAILHYISFALDENDAFQYLIEALNDAHPLVKETAIEALANLGNINAIAYIEPFTFDTRASLKETAQQAIKTLKIH